jgi:hypothetical protein
MKLDIPDLYDAVAFESLEKIMQFSAMNLVDMAEAHAASGHSHFKIMETIGFEIPKKFEMYSNHDLARSAKAFAVARMHAPQLFAALAARLLVKDGSVNGSLKSVAPRDVADLIWAFAYIGVESKPLFGAAALELLDNVDKLGQGDLVNVAWAYVCLFSKSLFRKSRGLVGKRRLGA